jgi:hypothetical protein
MKLNPLEKHLIQESIHHARDLLVLIKQKPRRGKDAEDLKTLEDALCYLDAFNASTYRTK